MAYRLIKHLAGPFMWVLYRIRVEGRERIPKTGPVILAANHRSFLDSFFIPLVLRRRVTFVAKAEYFDSWKTAWFFRSVGQIPIRREGGSASERALESATDVLQAGGIFAIYPEGTRTRDGYLHRGHTGVARLALRTGAPIYPVGLVGTDEAQPTHAKMPRFFRRITIRFGEPIPSEHYAGRQDDRLVLRQLTDEIMFEIQALSEYEYQNTYATRKAEDVPIEAAPLATLDSARVSAA